MVFARANDSYIFIFVQALRLPIVYNHTQYMNESTPKRNRLPLRLTIATTRRRINKRRSFLRQLGSPRWENDGSPLPRKSEIIKVLSNNRGELRDRLRSASAATPPLLVAPTIRSLSLLIWTRKALVRGSLRCGAAKLCSSYSQHSFYISSQLRRW